MSDSSELTTVRLGDKWVTTANDLTRAAHRLSLGEKRLVAACIAQVRSDSPTPTIADRERKTYTVTAANYADLYGVSRETAYEQMRANQKTLWARDIQTVKPDGKEGRKVRWVQEIAYNDGEGSVTLMWSDAVCTQLFSLSKEFTTYKLKHAARFTTKYAWTLFELLAMWRQAGRFTMDVDAFRDKMEVSATARANYKELRVRVIEPALREIQEKCGLVVTMNERKRGRRVSELAFSWEPDPQAALNF
jgi:plasmid replication initiation protein